MNSLKNTIYHNEDLPISVFVNEKEVEIKTDFRSWIKFSNICQDRTIKSSKNRIKLIFKAVVNGNLEGIDLEELINTLFSFYKLNKQIKQVPKSMQAKEEPYSFDCDWDLINASFKQEYGIDILSADMHWFQFKGLLDSLSEKTPLMRAIGYRTVDLSKIKDRETRKQLAELKNYWTIQKEDAPRMTAKEREEEMIKRAKGGNK